LTGNYVGQTYTRFSSNNGKHKHLMSVKAVVKQDAIDKGEDPEAAIDEYNQKRKIHQEEVSKVKEENREAEGRFAGERREAAIQEFRRKCGKLDTAIVQAFPGWMTRFDWNPGSGQTHVTYRDDEGKEWNLLKDIEAMFGGKLLAGEDVSQFIAKARRMASPIAAQEAKSKAVRQLKMKAQALGMSETSSAKEAAQTPAILAAMKVGAATDEKVAPAAPGGATKASANLFAKAQNHKATAQAADSGAVAIDDETDVVVEVSAQPLPKSETPPKSAKTTPSKTRVNKTETPPKSEKVVPEPKIPMLFQRGQGAPEAGAAKGSQRSKRTAKLVEPPSKQQKLQLNQPVSKSVAQTLQSETRRDLPAEENGEDVD